MKSPNRRGIILAGGQSRRMGQDKGLVLLKGKPLILWVVDQLLTTFSQVAIVQDRPGHYDELFREKSAGVEMIQDGEPYTGPLGGLKQACRSYPADILFLVGCDMPYLRPKVLEFILEQMAADLLAVVPEISGILQPLCAAYNAQAILDLNDWQNLHSPKGLFQRYPDRVKRLSEAEIAPLDPDFRSFISLDSPTAVVEEGLACRE